jgi:hypothetical protein
LWILLQTLQACKCVLLADRPQASFKLVRRCELVVLVRQQSDKGYFVLHSIEVGLKDNFNSLFNRLAIKEGWLKSQRKKRRHEAIASKVDAIYGTDTTLR